MKTKERNQDRRSHIKMSKSETILQAIIYILLFLFALACLLPFINVLASSFATPGEILTRPFILIPRTFTINAYKYILSTPTVMKSVGVSLFITVVGTFLSMLVTSLMAYGLSRTYLVGRRAINFMVVFTMLFSGGMIPGFLLVKNLGLMDSLWSLIIPSCVNAYNMIIMRNFFQGIPVSLEESAKIDGCSQIGIFFKIFLPLSLPSIATVSLFYAVNYWNTFQGAILYIRDANKWPIQILLRQVILVSSGLDADASAVDIVPPSQAIKNAVIVISTLPMLIIYPFVQKYFIKGATLGSVKG